MTVETTPPSCPNLKITYTSFSHYYTNLCCFIFIRIIIGSLLIRPIMGHVQGVTINVAVISIVTALTHTALALENFVLTLALHVSPSLFPWVLVYPRTRPLVLSRHTHFNSLCCLIIISVQFKSN